MISLDSVTTGQLIAFQVAIALTIFLGLNWLGRHSPMFGYETLTMFSEREDAVAFNFLFRVVTPVVIILVVAAFCYASNLGGLTKNLHYSVLYYLAIRVFFNVARGRAGLLPWRRLLLQWMATVALSFIAYEHLISKPEYLLPDVATISNEIWLAVAAYLYVLAGNVFSGDTGQEARGDRYIQRRLADFQGRFGHILQRLPSERWRLLVLAVLIVEDFNRPAVARFAERMLFRIGAAKTLGIMQVTTPTLIDDDESIQIGIQRLERAYQQALESTEWRTPGNGFTVDSRAYEESCLVHSILVRYNPSGDYARDVESVFEKLLVGCPRAAADSFVPVKSSVVKED
jgi:hypothetical protein